MRTVFEVCTPIFICYYLNVRGLNTKVCELYLAVSDGEFDILALTETFLHGDVLSCELFLDSTSFIVEIINMMWCSSTEEEVLLLAMKNSLCYELLDTSAYDCQFSLIDCRALKN